MTAQARFRKLLVPALLLSCMAVAFRFDAQGAAWFWTREPGVGVALALGAAITWGFALASNFKHRVD